MGFLSCNGESAIATCDPHYWDLRKKKTTTHDHNMLLPIREFHLSEIVAATDGFSADRFLGKGSHGSVYRATLDGGKLIAAVKTTKSSKSSPANHRNNHNTTPSCSGCGNCTSHAENEIEILSRVSSPRRLVNLLGFCTHSNNNKLIVVEYMPNGSLYDLLHSMVRPPGWNRRVRFALQIAKAIQELHSSNPPVIHRDVKSSNVLIDGDWNARLGDFGLALRGHVEDIRVKCTPPAGTLGYLDPCYLAPGDLSAKSDVFSFGILLLEIISGRNAIDVNYSPPSVVDWAPPLIKRGEFIGIFDRRIAAPSDTEVIRQLAVLAARCVRSTADKRPSMAEVVECLKLVSERIHGSPIWNSLRWGVARGENARPLLRGELCDYDWSEEVVKVVRSGSKWNRKVSSVPGVESESEPAINQVVRSRSIGPGSVSEIKMQPNSDPNSLGSGLRRRNAKMAVMRLKRSRSMVVLRCSQILRHGSENAIAKTITHDSNNGPINLSEMANSKLVFEEKMLEKPLVKSSY